MTYEFLRFPAVAFKCCGVNQRRFQQMQARLSVLGLRPLLYRY